MSRHGHEDDIIIEHSSSRRRDDRRDDRYDEGLLVPINNNGRSRSRSRSETRSPLQNDDYGRESRRSYKRLITCCDGMLCVYEQYVELANAARHLAE